MDGRRRDEGRYTDCRPSAAVHPLQGPIDRWMEWMNNGNLCIRTEKTLAPWSSAPATRSGSPKKILQGWPARLDGKPNPQARPSARPSTYGCTSTRRFNWLPLSSQVPLPSGGSDATASDVRRRYRISSIVPEAARRSPSKRHHIFVSFSFRASYLDPDLETRKRHLVTVRTPSLCISRRPLLAVVPQATQDLQPPECSAS